MFILGLFIVFSGALALAQPTAKIHDILVNADSMYRDTVNETAELEGNIQIVYQGQHIKADKARISLRSRQLELFGNVEIMDSKNTVVGDRVYLDYESNTGIIYDGYVQSGSVLFSGSILQKTADNEYLVSSADYTACTNCPATWSFSGENIRAEMGGYAYIKNAWLKIGYVPIFWFPYLIVPLKSDRQSGLLTPTYEISEEGGNTVSLPFFWAISPSSDATSEVKNYEFRGLKAMAEYRYVLDENSKGSLNIASLYDSVFATSQRLNSYRPLEDQNKTIDRWFARYEHYQQMPDGGVHRAQINLASDLQYAKDFPLETLNHGDSAMDNRVSYTKNGETSHVSIDSSYYVNMLHADPLAGNDDAVHRLPELHYSEVMQNIGRTDLLYNIDLSLVNFARSGNAYDDMTTYGTTSAPTNSCGTPNWEDLPGCYRVNDGVYNRDEDLIRTGQRLDFQPSFYYPIRFGDGLDIIPRLAYRETHYNFDIEDQPYLARRYVRTEVTGRTQFSRVFGDPSNPQSTRYKHEIVPEITYTRLPWYFQDDHPFFGKNSSTDSPYSSRDSITDLDIANGSGVQFDYNDRVYDRNLVTFALTNKITQKYWRGGTPQYRQIGYLKLAQSYDATQSDQVGREPWSDVSATLDVRMDSFQTYSIFNYFPYQNVTNASSRVRVLNNSGHFAQLAVSRQYKIIPGQEVDVSNRVEDYTASAGFVSNYINFMGKIVYDANWTESRTQDKIKSWATIVQLKPPGDCWTINAMYDQITGGDYNFRFSFEFTFDGVPKPPLPPETLDTYGF